MPHSTFGLRPATALVCLALLLPLIAAAQPMTPAQAQRQDEVRGKGAEVMPFSLDQTLHTFDKTEDGGIQRVRVRNAAPEQVAMVRSHLRSIAQSFAARDFSAPAHIHGADMPGMAQMKAAKPDELTVTYRELDDGAELDYVSHAPAIITAVHRWFDAQLADHGRDATTSAVDVKLGELAWLAGTWLVDEGDRRVEEIWTAPSSDLMIGMSRTLRQDRTISFAYMRIAARADGVFFVAQPHGRPPDELRLRSWDGRQAVFVNAGSGDHLRRVVYRNGRNGTMTVRIEGSDGGKDFTEEYPYHRRRSHRID